MNVLGLMQLCETAPSGAGYSHSFQIEQLARRKELTSAAQLTALLQGLLEAAIGPADGVASGIAFRAARGGDFREIPEVCQAMSSNRVPLEMRLASLQMGQRLWDKSRQWPWACAVHDQLDDLARRNDLHHAVAFGALVSEATSSQVRAVATYLFNTAKNIVSAAVKLIPLDEMEGERVLSSVQPAIARLANCYLDKHPGDIAVNL